MTKKPRRRRNVRSIEMTQAAKDAVERVRFEMRLSQAEFVSMALEWVASLPPKERNRMQLWSMEQRRVLAGGDDGAKQSEVPASYGAR